MATSASSPDKPKFRHEHLVAETIEERGGKFIDVMDPDSGNVFRFYEVEFSLACAMDGQRDVAGIVQWAREELGLAPTQAEVRTVIATLGELGYLDASGVARAAGTTPAERRPERPDDLAPGIIVPAQARAMATGERAPSEVELGHAGTLAAKPATPADPAKAPDLALGAPGASTVKPPPRPAVEDVALGAPGPSRVVPEARPQVSDVSLDLADHMGVRPDDVKEAVRQSKVMQAVDMPKDLDEPRHDAAVARPVVDTPAITRPESTPVPRRPEPSARPVQAEPPRVENRPAIVTRPTPTPTATDRPPVVAPPGPQPKVSPVLVVVLILVIGAAAAFLVWKYVLSSSNKDTGGDTTSAGDSTRPATPPPVKVDPPPPPPEPVVKLAMDTPAPADVKAAAAGTVEALDLPKTDPGAPKMVKRGTVVVKLVGYKQAATLIAVVTKQLDRVQAELTKAEADLQTAQAANNAVKAKEAERIIDDRKKSLAKKQDELAKAQGELDKLAIKAPVDGEVKTELKAGTKLTEGAALFTVVPSPVLVATFKKAGDAKPETNVFVAIKGTETKLTCRVTQVDANGAKVVCPRDAAMDGKEVTLGGPAPDEPEPIEMAPDPAPTPTPPPQPPKRPVVQPKPKPKDPPPEGSAAKPADPPPAEGSATP